jgi:hypothetical protein
VTPFPYYILSVDFGQVQDYSAIVLAEIHGQPPAHSVDLREATRLPLGTSYPDVVEAVCQRYAAIGRYLQERTRSWTHPGEWVGYRALVVDVTGVGRPPYDMLGARLRAEPPPAPGPSSSIFRLSRSPVPITFVGGTGFSRAPDGPGYHVSKVDLVSALAILFQSKPPRIRIGEALPQLGALLQEFLRFRQKIRLQGPDTYEAWRERDHDDLAFATMMACWYAQYAPVARTSKVLGV